MISADLANIADWIVGKAAKGEPLLPGAAGLLATTLLDLSHQAARLETVTVGRVLDEEEDRRHAG
jgi:hypothetical protein